MLYMRKRRGQAFETMMLVISVIVALAILGVLFNILGGVGSIINPSDPKKTISDQLNSIGGQYSSGTTPVEVTLKTGTPIRPQDVTQNNPNVLADQMNFYIEDSLKDSVEEEAGGGFTAKRDVQAFVVACGDGVKYGVVLGRLSDKGQLAKFCRDSIGLS